MHLARVPSSLLRHRLDGAYYHPEALALDARLRQLGNAQSLESLRDLDRPITNGVRGPELTDSEYKLVRLQDCIDWEVRTSDCISISAKQFAENARCRLRRNDVVVAIGGYVGNAAIVIDDAPAVIGQHSARVSLSSSSMMNPRFLLAYLNSEPGRVQFSRLMRGTVQQGLNLDDVEEIEVPVFHAEAQRYIGNKVRQAERLRERARNCRDHVATYFDELLNTVPASDPTKKHSRVPVGRLSTRINAEYYADRFTSIERALEQHFKADLLHLRAIAPAIRAKTRPIGPSRYREISDLDTVTGTFLDGTYYETVSAIPNNAQRKFDRGDIAVSTRRPNRGAVAVVDEQVDSDFYSIFLVRLKPRTFDLAYWITEYLRHDVGRRLLEQRCTWTTYPVISEDDLETIPVPYDPAGWERVGKWARDASTLQRSAHRLTDAAKLLVEALIEGKVSESDLVSAQKALESGDRSADRALLQSLRQGESTNAPTLFANLDALYALLDDGDAAGGSD